MVCGFNGEWVRGEEDRSCQWRFGLSWGIMRGVLMKGLCAQMDVDENKVHSFAVAEDFGQWFAENHAGETVLWLKIYKKGSGVSSVTWEEAVIEALAWGWIDGIKKSNDATSWFQRFTPRKAKSVWSKKNRGHVEKLIAEGRMQAPGMAQVEAAKADGRWDAAYAGSAQMEIPEDFLVAVAKDAIAQQTFDGLNRSNLFAIYGQLQTAKKPETRQKRMKKIIAMLARGEKLQ